MKVNKKELKEWLETKAKTESQNVATTHEVHGEID